MLSKYTAGLFVIAVTLWLVFTPQMQRWLRRPWPWLAAGLAFLCFLPVLIWNAGHGWASFAKQGGRLARWGWESVRPGMMLEYIGGQMVLLTPGLFLLLLSAVWLVAKRASRQSGRLDTLLALWFIVPAAFFLVVSPLLRVQANWLAPAWPAAFLALASLIERHGDMPKLRLALSWSHLMGAAMLAVVWCYAAAPFGPDFKSDPLARLNGQRAFAADVAEFARRNGSTQIIAADYATASMLRFYAPPDMAVAHIADKPRYAGFANSPITLPAVVVTRGASPPPDRIAQRYRIGPPVVSWWRNYRGKPHSRYMLSIAHEAQP